MLIICSECGKEYSDQAKTCPHCGAITSQNRYISSNKGSINRSYPNNNIGGTNGGGCLTIVILLILFFIGFKLFFGSLGLLGLDKDTMKSTFKEAWDFKFWDNDTSSKSKSSSSSSVSSTNRIYNIGEKITTDKFEITVVNVEEKSTIGSKYTGETAGEGNTYICFKIRIKNISNEPIGTFSQPSVSLVDSKNTTYNIDISASTLYAIEADDTSQALSDLNPGVIVNDTGVFQIGKEYYSRNTFKLKISADKTVLVKIK